MIFKITIMVKLLYCESCEVFTLFLKYSGFSQQASVLKMIGSGGCLGFSGTCTKCDAYLQAVDHGPNHGSKIGCKLCPNHAASDDHGQANGLQRPLFVSGVNCLRGEKGTHDLRCAAKCHVRCAARSASGSVQPFVIA